MINLRKITVKFAVENNMSITVESEGRKIKVDSKIVELMNSYKQLTSRDCEAGGILIGRENKNTRNLIIEYATEPYEKDKRTRSSYIRKDKRHMQIFNELYNENNSIYAYVGEWHTHPEEYPNYSSVDINNWKQIAKINQDKDKVYYHVIVGTNEIRMWKYQHGLKIATRIL